MTHKDGLNFSSFKGDTGSVDVSSSNDKLYINGVCVQDYLTNFTENKSKKETTNTIYIFEII